MNAPIDFASNRSLLSVAAEAGFFELPAALQDGLKDMLVGAIEVMRKNLDDPERGDTGWRKQTLEEQLKHAQGHAITAWAWVFGNGPEPPQTLDDDGLEHWKHAAARLGLACCVRRLTEDGADTTNIDSSERKGSV